MKKLLVGLYMMVACVASATTVNLNWFVDGNTYAQTTCESGGNLIIPTTNPTKRGYHFVGWEPRNYMQLDYIESTGTQYIDTGIKAATGLNIEVKAKLISYGAIFGSRRTDANSSTRNALWFAALAERTLWLYGNSIQHNYLPVISLNTWHTIETIGGAYYLDKEYIASYAGQTIPSGQNMLLFANRSGDSMSFSGDLQISVFKIYNEAGQIQNLVPARRISDNEVGMYDTVTDTFFTNQGTGDFVAGPVSANQTLE